MNDIVKEDKGAPPAGASKNSAWVRVPAPYSVTELMVLCQDFEALIRVNPYYHFIVWKQTGPDQYHVRINNHSTQHESEFDISIKRDSDSGFTAEYSNGLKTHTTFNIEATDKGSMLTIVDNYAAMSKQEEKEREKEIDKSLQAWGVGLAAYFARLKKWSKIPGWRFYIRRIWIPMKPSGRRIVWWLYLITLAEFGFFLFVYIIWLIERTAR
jgi:hypothetical protein